MDDAKGMFLMRMRVVNMLTAVDVDERVDIANSESNGMQDQTIRHRFHVCP